MAVEWGPIDPVTGQPVPGRAVDFSKLPRMAPPSSNRNPISAGLAAGTQEAIGLGATAVEAVGTATGFAGMRDWAARAAANRFERAAQAGRPDLETPFWNEGGGGLAAAPSWLAYQASRMAPSMALMIAAGAAVPRAAVPAALSRAGAAVPRLLGGGGLRAGMTATAREAAERTGQAWARDVTGATIAGYPLAVGELYDSAKQGGIADRESAVAALAGGVPFAAIEALEPAQLRRLAEPVQGEKIVKGIAKAVGATALAQIPQEGLQTAMEMGFRPDLTVGEKMQNVVDAGLTAAAVGGLFGGVSRGVGQLRAMKTKDGAEVTSDDLSKTVDEALQAEQPPIDPSEVQQPAEQPPVVEETPAQQWDPQAQLAAALGERAAGAKINPILEQLRAAGDVTDQVRTVQDMLEARGGKVPATLARLAEHFGLRNPDGTPRDLRIEIADLDTRLRIETQGPTPDEQVVGELQSRRAQLTEQQAVLDSVTARAETNKQTVKDYAKTAIFGKGNPYVAKVGAENLTGLLEDAMTRIESDRITPSVTKIADHFNLQETPEKSGFRTEIDLLNSRIALAEREVAADPAKAAELEPLVRERDDLQQRQTAVDAVFAKRAEPVVTPQAEPVVEAPAVLPPTTPKEVVAQAVGTTSRSNPVVRELEGVTDQADLVGRVMDYVSERGSKKLSPSWVKVAEAVGLANPDGTPRDLAGDIETINQQLRVIDPEATDQIVELETRREALQKQAQIVATAQTNRAPWMGWAVPAPPAEPVVAPGPQINAELPIEAPVSAEPGATLAVEPVISSPASSIRGPAPVNPTSALSTRPTLAPAADAAMQPQIVNSAPAQAGPVEAQPAAAGGAQPPLPPEPPSPEPPLEGGGDQPPAGPSRTVPELNAALKSTVGAVSRGWELLKGTPSMRGALRKASMGWRSVTDLFDQYGRLFDDATGGNTFQRYIKARQERDAIHNQVVQMQREALDAFYALEKSDPKAAATVQELMRFTAYDIDPRKSWEDHKWLQDDPNAAFLKGKVEEARKLYRELVSKKQQGVYDNLLAVNNADWYSRLAVQMQNFVDKTFPDQPMVGFEAHPMDGYMANSSLHTDPAGARDFWKAEVEKRVAGATAFAQASRAAGRKASVKTLDDLLKTVKKDVSSLEQSPYFHLGRSGDYMVAMTMATDEEGVVDPATVQAIADRLDANGFGDVSLNSGTGVSGIYMRVENLTQQQQLADLAKKMRADGLLQADKPILQGPRSDDTIRKAISPEWLEDVIDKIEDTDLFEMVSDMSPDQRNKIKESRAEMRAALTSAWLDLLPDNSLSRVLARRRVVPGYAGDMVKSFAFRSDVSASALANLTSAPRASAALRDMRVQLKNSRENEALGTQDRQRMFDTYAELSLREALRPWRAQQSFVDNLAAVNHAYFLSLSPAYMLTQITSLPVLLWPELSKTHGFAKSGKAMADVTPMAFKIMSAVAKEGIRHGNLRWADAAVSEKALKRAGIPQDVIDFVMGMVNRGHIDIGGYAREMARNASKADESKFDRALRFAGVTSVYPEALTRLIAGLAARQLHGNKAGLEKYADNVVEQSLFNWSTWNTARQTSKAGFAGPLSRVFFAFHTYVYQLIEKMYREMGAALWRPGVSKEERTASRKWVGAHLAAVGLLAGSQGLPLAAPIAMAIDKLADLLGDDEDKPYNVQIAWRNWLADTFGDGVGEVLARGAPRALGFDLSTRVGEQNIMPFSKLLTDRREFNDAWAAWIASAAGAPTSMFANLLQGMSDVSKGDWLTGAKTMVPVSVKSPIEAFKMTTEGYVDRAGNKMPMTPGAAAIMLQFAGLTPAEKAEYAEGRQADQSRKMTLSRQASTLRRQLASAIENGDRDTALELIQKAQEFDAAHPERPSVVASLSTTLTSRARARAESQAFGTPLGTDVRDRTAVDNLRFMNIGQ